MPAQHRRPNRTLGLFSAEDLMEKIAREAYLSTPLFIYHDVRGNEHVRVAFCVKILHNCFEVYRAGGGIDNGRLIGPSDLQRACRTSSEASVTHMFREYEKSYFTATHVGGSNDRLVSVDIRQIKRSVQQSTRSFFEQIKQQSADSIRVLLPNVPEKRPLIRRLTGNTYH